MKKSQRVYLSNVVIFGIVTNLCVKRDIWDGSFLFLITSFQPEEAAILTVTYCIVIKVAVFLQVNSNPVYKNHGFLAKSWVNQAFSFIKRAISFNYDISPFFFVEVPCF